MRRYLKNKKDVSLFIVTIIAIFFAIVFILNIISNNKSLERIIYNAKKEAEQTLISTGRAVYVEDIENNGYASVQNNLPENSTATSQGTVVKPKDNWNIETVTAVSVGNGDTVPVPIGFYYVGGDLNTGVIISDSE